MDTSDHPALTAIRHLTLAEIDQRLTDLDSERAALSLLRRALLARDRARRRRQPRQETTSHDHQR